MAPKKLFECSAHNFKTCVHNQPYRNVRDFRKLIFSNLRMQLSILYAQTSVSFCCHQTCAHDFLICVHKHCFLSFLFSGLLIFTCDIYSWLVTFVLWIFWGLNLNTVDVTEAETEIMKEDDIAIPNLRSLVFFELPPLEVFCSHMLVFSCLQSLLFDCPKLKRLPFSLQITSNRFF